MVSLSGKAADGGIALLCKISLDNYVRPLENIDSDCIVGIPRNFPGYDILYILGDCQERQHMEALLYCTKSHLIIM